MLHNATTIASIPLDDHFGAILHTLIILLQNSPGPFRIRKKLAVAAVDRIHTRFSFPRVVCKRVNNDMRDDVVSSENTGPKT
jgi:hypothetical protein